MTASTSDRFLGFAHTDALRGVAILLIMAQHLGGAAGTRLLTPCGGIGVALFLFMSGYGLNESCKRTGLRRFWTKKLLRVWLPYLFFSAFCWLVLADGFNVRGFLLDVSGVACSYWYVSFLFVQYALFYATTRLCPSHRMGVMALAGVFVLLWCAPLRAEQAFSFVAGVAASTRIEKLRNVIGGGKMAWTVMAVALLCGLSFLALKQLPAVRAFEDTPVQSVVQLLCKVPLAASLLMSLHLCRTPAALKAVLAFLGMVSYELYLVHMQFLPMLSQGDFALRALMLVALSVALSWLFHKFNNWYYLLLLKK